ncbi:aldo/keto reductase [Paramicrobacterium chengjingii]|uniref:Aldo/keto reductase n=1 Tax=Paramicrobacterium chengjingii TaxID=2769067 RepID=A0ABX6YEJ7_9MICO|nr:aldo/keto reductase [Microbacterium chengjingii]QPZ37228.1 aldo/keto reductase [Microbacterium chengjingii]
MAEMNYRPLGRSGLMVSATGLGCNNFGRAGTATETQAGTDAVIEAALEVGVTLFDTADMYGKEPGLSETLMGNSIRGRRDKIVLATKFGHSNADVGLPSWGAKGSRRYVRLAVEASLRRLQTDWIDLYQLHTPDPITPIAETLSTLDELITEGKIRYIGHSNLASWQVIEADLRAELNGNTKFISAQNEYNLAARDAEHELLPAVRHVGLGFLPFFPLNNGLFTGKFNRAGGPGESRIMRQRRHIIENAPWEAMDRYQAFCDARGVTMLQATFAWLLAQPSLTSVIAGATSPEQVQQNADAASAWQPTADDIESITAIFD